MQLLSHCCRPNNGDVDMLLGFGKCIAKLLLNTVMYTVSVCMRVCARRFIECSSAKISVPGNISKIMSSAYGGLETAIWKVSVGN